MPEILKSKTERDTSREREAVLNVRSDFPILNRRVNGKPLVYLDSAATSQKPAAVLQALQEYYTQRNANVHRGVYTLSEEATQDYEEAHKKAAAFIGAAGMEEIIFTRNTTESLNLLSYSLGARLRAGDSIALTQMEHHSNIVPWQQLAKRTGAEVRYIPITADGVLDTKAAAELIDETTKIVSFTHVSNVLGTINDVSALTKLAKQNGAFSIVDAAQSVPQMPVDVQKLGCDFLAFSSHKMLGPTGIGVLYGRRELLEALEPFNSGGDMIKRVTFEGAEWNDLPWRFEAGTPNIADGIAFGAAVDYLQALGMEKIQRHEASLTRYAMKRLAEVEDIVIYGPSAEKRGGVVSFNLNSIHPHDVAQVLDDDAVCIRGGHHCAMPLMGVLRIAACCRASFHVYNNFSDIDKLVGGLNKVRKVFLK